MTLAGSEVALKVTGSLAKNVAVALAAGVSSQEKTKGKTRLATMLKSGKELTVFQLKQKDLKVFAEEAKKYGVLYVVVKETKGDENSTIDLMVKAEDASKLNRILKKLNIGSVDKETVAKVVHDIESERAAKTPDTTEIGVEDKDKAARLMEELLGKPVKVEPEKTADPLVKTPEVEIPSEPTSGRKPRSEKATTDRGKQPGERASVKAEIDGIKRDRAEKAEPDKPKTQAVPVKHQQPTPKRGHDTTRKAR
jgi:hypothetical protein